MPDEGLWLVVVVVDEAADVLFEFFGGSVSLVPLKSAVESLQAWPFVFLVRSGGEAMMHCKVGCRTLANRLSLSRLSCIKCGDAVYAEGCV